MFTHFASPDRAGAPIIEDEVARLTSDPGVSAMLEALGGVVLVLNHHRQVVGINAHFLESIGVEDPVALLGLRPGELLSCLHAKEAPSGCGTGAPCRQCGAVLAILAAQEGSTSEPRTCLVSRGGDDLVFRVQASPIEVEGQAFTLVTLQDLQDQMERLHLERVFLHDLSNAMVGLQLLSYGASDELPDDFSGPIATSLDRVTTMLWAERRRLHIEAGTYEPQPQLLRLGQEVEAVVSGQRSTPLAEERELVLCYEADPVVDADEALLGRVLENMVLNALEATEPHQRVTILVSTREQAARVEVHNPGLIPPEVRPRIFTRWYSTKGKGRGLGTWSMYHLTHRYLAGEVGFASEPGAGTTFWLELTAVPDEG